MSARTVSRSGRPHEDMVAAVGQLADGTMVNHLVNWLSPLKERSTVVTGERGCFVADTLTADLTFYANGADRHRVGGAARVPRRRRGRHDPVRHPEAGAAAGRARALPRRGGGQGTSDIVTLRQGLRTVEVAAAVLESAKDGSTARLDHAG